MAKNRVEGKGVYNAICDVCGFKYKNYEMKRRWDGAIVCKDDWETRHPQEFLRVRNDQRPLPWTRPERDVPEAEGAPSIFGVVDLGTADAARVNLNTAS